VTVTTGTLDARHGLTDAYQAERFAATYGTILRYDHARKFWFVFRDHLWRQDDDGGMSRLAIECARVLHDEADEIPDSTTRQKVQKFSKFCQSGPGIQRVLGIAKNLPPIAIRGEAWNRNPWLLGAPNGVIDTRRWELCDGSPSDLVSLSIGVPFDFHAECERWRDFVGEIFGGDGELVEYLQRVLGYALTGFTREQVWWLFYGEGANGKSTFLNVIAYVLGDYAKTAPFSMFELPHRSSVPDDLATLVDRRYVTANESIEAARLDEARIKMLTGGDKVPARPLYGTWFEFDPQLKLFLSCNHKPKVADDSHGFWRRVHVVPFTQRFEGPRQDKGLPETLKAEGSGILNWMLEGCIFWRELGLLPPQRVLAATADYESEANPLNDFVAARCEEGSTFRASSSELYSAYLQWSQGTRPTTPVLTATAFGRWMGKRFKKRHVAAGNFYEGVRLVTATPPV
jgi:putative DNA primase/helicase